MFANLEFEESTVGGEEGDDHMIDFLVWLAAVLLSLLPPATGHLHCKAAASSVKLPLVFALQV